MLRLILILAVVGAGLASYPPKYQKRRCYQCEYVPPKNITTTVYEVEEVEEEHPQTKVKCTYEFEFYGDASEIDDRPENDCKEPTCIHETVYKTVKTTRNVPKVLTELTRAGGFEACKGPITPVSAKIYGVDDWECHDNCYVRKDAYGRISRGCYKDELDVDPNLLGCNKQGGYTYCFCDGSNCNGGNPT